MFTGIVQGFCEVTAVERDAGITRLTVAMDGLTDGLETGASVALNGTCVTVVAVEGAAVRFELVRETTTLSNLGQLQSGDRVNVERSFRVGDEVGGHILSGHIAGTVVVAEVRDAPGHRRVRFTVPAPMMPYLMDKGFIALDGASLTIAALERSANAVEVSLIPETLARTGFGDVAVGDRVNLEVDSRTQAIVDTVREMLRDEALLEQLRGV